MSRTIHRRYRDGLDVVWLETARRMGFAVERSPEVYASTDGARTIVIGTPETLDPDDCLAQMIFHELCHAMVQGPELIHRPDWGLDNMSDRDVPREHACLRLQAHLAARHGLRDFLAPTTDFRAFYDALPPDPLTPAGDVTVGLALEALARAARPPFAPHLDEALAATARVRESVRPFAGEDEGLRSLWEKC